MAKRTEEEIVTQACIEVVLGGKKYQVKPLAIKYSLPWVKEVAALLGNVLHLTSITSDDEEAFSSGLSEIMVEKPERFIDLFFKYAKDLDRDEIEESATGAEIERAFEEVLTLERPLFGMAIQILLKAIPPINSA